MRWSRELERLAEGAGISLSFQPFPRPTAQGRLDRERKRLAAPSASRPGDDGVRLSILLVFSPPLLHMMTVSQAAALSETVFSIESGGTLE